MRAVSRVALTVAVVLACLSGARARGPISTLQCSTINPNPIVTTCTYYLPPIVDLYGNIPYDSIPAYTNCVKQRCVCTGAAVDTDITISGIYCNESGWMETGYTTCNRMNHCFEIFWKCMNTAVMDRYDNNYAELTNAEMDLATDITVHGRTPGEQFKVTDTYRSCRLKMCAATASRESCGLTTCLPNYTQCNEYILPPPLPNNHQLCTQGCRAVLLMMAMTIALVSFSFCCMCCCPAQVKIREPVIQEDDKSKKTGEEDDESGGESGSQAAKSHSGTQPKSDQHPDNNAATSTNHNSHLSSKASHQNGNDNAANEEATTPHTEAQQRANNNNSNNDPF